MIVVVAALACALCVAASVRRLWFVTHPTALHPDDVIALATGPTAIANVRDRIAEVPEADWERDLVEALGAPNADARIALVNEQLTELDLRIGRWERVPRVCASVATSVGIMLGTLVLRDGLANAPDLSGEGGERFVRAIVSDAISVAAWGMVGTAFCIAAHAQARRIGRDRLAAADRMVEKLESPSA